MFSDVNWILVIALVNFLVNALTWILKDRDKKRINLASLGGFVAFLAFFGYIYLLVSLGSFALNQLAKEGGIEIESIIIAFFGFPLGGLFAKYLLNRELKGQVSMKNATILFYYQIFLNPLISFLVVGLGLIIFALVRSFILRI